jgi:hypothetical protein
MKAGSQMVLLCERSAFLESVDDLVAVWQIGNVVASLRVSFQRENLAVDAETADAAVSTVSEGGEQGVSVVQAQVGQLRQGVGPIHPGEGGRRGRAELDRLVSKDTAKTKANHGFPQFITVIDN